MQTQSTVLSLRALVLYFQYFSGIKGSGTFALYYNGDLVEEKPFDTQSEDVSSLSSFDFSDSLNKVYNGEENFKIELKIKNSKTMKNQKV